MNLSESQLGTIANLLIVLAERIEQGYTTTYFSKESKVCSILQELKVEGLEYLGNSSISIYYVKDILRAIASLKGYNYGIY